MALGALYTTIRVAVATMEPEEHSLTCRYIQPWWHAIEVAIFCVSDYSDGWSFFLSFA
jgi:hypothetical protein